MNNQTPLKVALFFAMLFIINQLSAQDPCANLDNTGYVVDYTGLDGCGLVIALNDGTVLEPAIVPDNITLYAGQLLQFSYIERNFISICMVGPTIEITCAVEFACTCEAPISGPVCANGITYDSDCTAGCLGINDYDLGSCDIQCDLNQSNGWLEFLDSDFENLVCAGCQYMARTYTNESGTFLVVEVNPSSFCPDAGSITIYNCSGEIFCTSTSYSECSGFFATAQFRELITFGDNCPCQCNDQYEPVCGSDGVTYFSGCVAECEGVFDYTPGECPPSGECTGPWVDSDNDGICDAADICPGFDDYIDSDSDGIPDGCDDGGNPGGTGTLTGNTGDEPCVGPWIDSDADGVCDAADICAGADDYLDVNGNGVPDGCDNGGGNGEGTLTGNTGNELCPVPWIDSDADGVCNAADVCEGADDYLDTNANGIPDGCEGGGTSPNYCTSTGLNTTFEYIESVVFENLNNVSGNNGGYGDYTNLSASVSRGTAASVSLTPGFAGADYLEYWKIWIDYNQDGDFEDAGEETFNGSAFATATTGTVNIPLSATLGSTRMRISMRWNSDMSPCTDIPYGEVEDYTINISGTAYNDNPPALRVVKPQIAMNLYPNPVHTKLSIELENANQNGQLEIYDNVGRLIQTKNIANDEQLIEIPTSNFNAGIYMVRLQVDNEIPIVKRFIKN